MLTCKEFLDELSDYLDETASGEIRRELEAHLTACPNCWVIADTTRKTVKIYKGMEPQPISEELRDRLLRALSKKMAGGRGGAPSAGPQA